MLQGLLPAHGLHGIHYVFYCLVEDERTVFPIYAGEFVAVVIGFTVARRPRPVELADVLSAVVLAHLFLALFAGFVD